jgi:phospholipase/carboxylesterase
VRALLFLHGHDDTADRWKAAAEAMAPGGWIVERPTGPFPTKTGASWFGSGTDGLPRPAEVRTGLDALAASIRSTATRLGATPADLALVGFSQGAALALLHALTPGTEPVGAVAAVAGWLPDVDGIAPDLDRLGTARLLLAHGRGDEVVPYPLGRSVARLLERRGHAVRFVERDAGHTPDPFSGDVRAWLDALSATA